MADHGQLQEKVVPMTMKGVSSQNPTPFPLTPKEAGLQRGFYSVFIVMGPTVYPVYL